jgi:CheY-like chemotaxis protein
VTHAENADEALGMLEAGVTFDLVFSDLVMPGERDGLDLARVVRERWPHLPLLLATGYSDAANRATQEGFTLLIKPYPPSTLLSVIQQATMEAPSSGPSNVIPLTRTSLLG